MTLPASVPAGAHPAPPPRMPPSRTPLEGSPVIVSTSAAAQPFSSATDTEPQFLGEALKFSISRKHYR